MQQYIVQIKPQGYLLFVNQGESVLEAALRQEYEFPYSCGGATCGTCMGKVLSGTFTYGNIEPYALDQKAQEEHYALFCSVKPTSNMVIEVEEVYPPNFLPARKVEYTIDSYNIVNGNIYRTFLTAKKKHIQYYAGQYLNIICDDGIQLPFSIANKPNQNSIIELHVKMIIDNPYVTEIIKKIEKSRTLQIRAPFGNMIYHTEIDYPIILLAGGTGIVPIKAVIEQALANGDPRPMHLYWGGKNNNDLYLLEQMQVLAEQHDNFYFTPVISDNNKQWQGKTGPVHNVIIKEYDDLSHYQVYASGPTEMVYAAFDAFTKKGLKPQLIYSDTFECFPR